MTEITALLERGNYSIIISSEGSVERVARVFADSLVYIDLQISQVRSQPSTCVQFPLTTALPVQSCGICQVPIRILHLGLGIGIQWDHHYL